MTKAKSRSQSRKAKKPQTKISNVIKLLARNQGATLDQMMQATGWQKHTVRAALTGLRKKGYAIAREANGLESIYRIAVSEQ